MKTGTKRLASGIVAAAVLVTACLITPPARAEAMTMSENGIALIKEYEGFSNHVYWDSGSAFIGYGTICKSTDYPNGISQETGDALLREALRAKESEVNQFLSKNGVKLSQNQFDAVLDLTYNIGTSWMSSSCRLYNQLKNGAASYPDIEIVNAFGIWCHQGKSIVSKLVERRLREAKIFLYNDYTSNGAHDYRYLTFDADGGEIDNSMQFFELGKTYGAIQTPARSGYSFAGWYTKNGTAVTPSTVVSQNLAVTATWTTGTAPVQAGLFPDVAATDWYYKYIVDLSASKIIAGYDDGAFHPNDPVSCGMALKLILLAVGFEAQQPTGSHWASGYLSLALSKGIVAEGEIGDLNAPIDRRMIAQISAKALGLPPIDTQEATFADTADGFVLALYHVNIITGSTESGRLVYRPQNSMTRAEISAVIWRISNSGLIQS
jgi:uncharacterized repeat protein (TIGR02543 family)